MSHSLTKPERETVINWSDEDSTAYIWTAQRPMITKLRANESAREIQSGFVGTTEWAEFTLPAALVSLRAKRRALTEKQRANSARVLKRARDARRGLSA